jgi:tetratricopeptide (TPR) repeat protein
MLFRPRTRIAIVLISTSIVTSILAAVSPAALADEQATAQARIVWRRALQHYNLAEWEDALKDYTEAYRLHPDPSFLFNIGQCHRQLNHHQEAVTFYRAYLRNVPDAANRDAILGIIAKEEATLTEEAATRKLPPPGPVEPGAPPRTALDDRADRDAEPAQHPGRGYKIAALATGGAGVTALILGGVFAIMAGSASDELNHPQPGTVFDASVEQRMNTDRNLSIAMFAVGGALTATGVTLAVLGFRAERRASVRAQLAPLLGRGRAGLAAEVHF